MMIIYLKTCDHPHHHTYNECLPRDWCTDQKQTLPSVRLAALRATVDGRDDDDDDDDDI